MLQYDYIVLKEMKLINFQGIIIGKTNEYINLLEWEKKYQNPVEITEIIGTFIDNNDKYSINMWISLDQGIFINVTNNNVDEIIKYIYERYPW